jgi:hypothetical protein
MRPRRGALGRLAGSGTQQASLLAVHGSSCRRLRGIGPLSRVRPVDGRGLSGSSPALKIAARSWSSYRFFILNPALPEGARRCFILWTVLLIAPSSAYLAAGSGLARRT